MLSGFRAREKKLGAGFCSMTDQPAKHEDQPVLEMLLGFALLLLCSKK
jgi:hypothetical protein